MPNVFIISDTHFSHKGSINWKKEDGTNVRSFSNIDEMDELMIENWNSLVKPGDRVYHLGDVALKQKGVNKLFACQGTKILIKGNHDDLDLDVYTPHFADIRACHKFDQFIMTHIPIHPAELGRFKGNVHGHIHERLVVDQYGKPDVRYKNVCVEKTNYSPIPIEELQKYFSSI